MGKEQPGWKP